MSSRYCGSDAFTVILSILPRVNPSSGFRLTYVRIDSKALEATSFISSFTITKINYFLKFHDPLYLSHNLKLSLRQTKYIISLSIDSHLLMLTVCIPRSARVVEAISSSSRKTAAIVAVGSEVRRESRQELAQPPTPVNFS